MYRVVSYFTDRGETVDRPEFGYADKDHIQWVGSELETMEDAKAELVKVAMGVLKDNLTEYGNSAKALMEDSTVGIFYDDGDITTLQIFEGNPYAA